jgi:hypothetical protein
MRFSLFRTDGGTAPPPRPLLPGERRGVFLFNREWKVTVPHWFLALLFAAVPAVRFQPGAGMRRKLFTLAGAVSVALSLSAAWVRAKGWDMGDTWVANPDHPGGWGALPFLFAGLAAVLFFASRAKSLRERRQSRGLCPACGYDLRATPERCPECGMAAAKGERA